MKLNNFWDVINEYENDDEFLEFLLSYVEPKNKVMDIAQSIVEPVLEIMMESLKNQDEVMQVQLINLLKVLIVGTSNIHDKYK